MNLPTDAQILPLFSERSPENRNALWALFDDRWEPITGSRLANAWDGFCCAYQSFDPNRTVPGFVAQAFLRLMALECKGVRRRNRAIMGPGLRVSRRSKRLVVRMTPEEWADLAVLPEADVSARLEGVDGKIRVVGLRLLGQTAKRLEVASKRVRREGDEK